jgi:hypothetical protein
MFPMHAAAQYQYLLWLHPFFPMILEKHWLIMGSTDQCAIVISSMRPYLILQIVYGIDDFSFPFLQGS